MTHTFTLRPRRTGRSKEFYDQIAEAFKNQDTIVVCGPTDHFIKEMRDRKIIVEELPKVKSDLVCFSRFQPIYANDRYEPYIIGYKLKPEPEVEYHRFKIVSRS